MKQIETTKVYHYLAADYRYTYHFGSAVMEIEVYEKRGIFSPARWRRIYFGHDTPLVRAIDFYKEQYKIDTEQRKKHDEAKEDIF